MVVVKRQPGKSEDSMIREFSRKVLLEGILLEAKRRQQYYKPSMAKKVKKEEKRRLRKILP